MLCQQQRRGIALLAPPAEDGFRSAQLSGRYLPEHAQHVVIGEFAVVIAYRGGAIENDRDQIAAERFLKSFNKLIKLDWHAVALVILPISRSYQSLEAPPPPESPPPNPPKPPP